MTEKRVQRRLAAILAADVVGYSRMVEADEEGTRARLRSIRTELIDPQIAADGGRIVKTMGDGLLIEFPSAVDAVRSALDIMGALHRRNATTAQRDRIEFRVGINVGDVIVEGDDIQGDGVNIASRLEGICEPGEVYVAGTVFDQAAGKLPATFESLGDRSLKNIAKPVRVYRVTAQPKSAARADGAGGSLPLPDKPSIAVLPFVNISGDAEQEYFSDGITEDLITALSQIREFFVIARNSSFTYKNRSVDVRQVGRDLGVRYVLEGSVRKAGGQVRITAQLVEAASGAHVWASRYDRDLENIFALQDEITQTVVGVLGPELSRAEQQRALMKPPENLDAWELFHRGMFYLNRRTEEANAQAQRYFEQAIERDPNFAAAYAGIARSLAADWIHVRPGRSAERAFAMARRAVELDEGSASSHFALGVVQMLIGRDGAAALRSLSDSIALNPNNAMAYTLMGVALMNLGRAEEAISHTERAIRLSPSDSSIGIFYGWLAMANLFLGRYEAAAEWGTRAAQKPGTWLDRVALPAALAELGRSGEAKEACRELRALFPYLTLEIVRRTEPVSHPPYLNLLCAGLRKAGLPES